MRKGQNRFSDWSEKRGIFLGKSENQKTPFPKEGLSISNCSVFGFSKGGIRKPENHPVFGFSSTPLGVENPENPPSSVNLWNPDLAFFSLFPKAFIWHQLPSFLGSKKRDFYSSDFEALGRALGAYKETVVTMGSTGSQGNLFREGGG